MEMKFLTCTRYFLCYGNYFDSLALILASLMLCYFEQARLIGEVCYNRGWGDIDFHNMDSQCESAMVRGRINSAQNVLIRLAMARLMV